MESSVLELEVKFVETDPNKGVTIGLGPHSKEATNHITINQQLFRALSEEIVWQSKANRVMAEVELIHGKLEVE